MSELLRYLLTSPSGAGLETPALLQTFWEAHRASAKRFAIPIDRALVGGLAADRLGFAFAVGYQAALAAMLPELAGDALCSMCVTEQGGGHPRAIRTTLQRDDTGQWRLRGKKRWATLAPHASELFVAASIGVDAAGLHRLRVVRVASNAPGVRLSAMPPTPFVPEIPHAELELDGVAVAEADVLEGDGYERYLKPFRTFEDVHVHGALLGYLLGAGRRHGWPSASLERIVAAIVTVRALADAPAGAPETHVALAGLIEEGRRIIAGAEPLWERADEAERARWERDRPLLDIAANVREARRARAWERLSGRAPEATDRSA